jgi:hypothetical protein
MPDNGKNKSNTYKLKIVRKFSYIKPFIIKERIGSTGVERILLKITNLLFKEKK